jgi:hypothetical protein
MKKEIQLPDADPVFAAYSLKLAAVFTIISKL